MYFVKTQLLRLLSITVLLTLSACGGDITDDLNPSDADLRPVVTSGTIGHSPGQIAADFSLRTSTDEIFQLSEHLALGPEPADAVVLYFTMWCPVCLAHSDHMLNLIVPTFEPRGKVVFALVDYVSGTVSGARASELANGYAGSAFVTVVDSQQGVMGQFNAAMGSVVVIDGEGTILLNEDYRNGERLNNVLDELLP